MDSIQEVPPGVPQGVHQGVPEGVRGVPPIFSPPGFSAATRRSHFCISLEKNVILWLLFFGHSVANHSLAAFHIAPTKRDGMLTKTAKGTGAGGGRGGGSLTQVEPWPLRKKEASKVNAPYRLLDPPGHII